MFEENAGFQTLIQLYVLVNRLLTDYYLLPKLDSMSIATDIPSLYQVFVNIRDGYYILIGYVY